MKLMTREQHNDAAIYFFVALDSFITHPTPATFESITTEMAVINAAMMGKQVSNKGQLTTALNGLLAVMEKVLARFESDTTPVLTPDDIKKIHSTTHHIDSAIPNVTWKHYKQIRNNIEGIVQGTLGNVMKAKNVRT